MMRLEETPAEPFATWRRKHEAKHGPLSPEQERQALKAKTVIQQVLSEVTEEEWHALAQGVLRRIARGEGEVSDETRQFARDMLSDQEAAIPHDDEEDGPGPRNDGSQDPDPHGRADRGGTPREPGTPW